MRTIFERWGGVMARGLLYFAIPFLAIAGEKLAPYADNDVWPSTIKWMVILIIATGAGLVTLRAYLDGSAQRRSTELKNGDGNGTTFLKQ